MNQKNGNLSKMGFFEALPDSKKNNWKSLKTYFLKDFPVVYPIFRSDSGFYRSNKARNQGGGCKGAGAPTFF